MRSTLADGYLRRWKFDEGDLVVDYRSSGDPHQLAVGLVVAIFVDVDDASRLVLVRVMWASDCIEDFCKEEIALIGRLAATCKVPG